MINSVKFFVIVLFIASCEIPQLVLNNGKLGLQQSKNKRPKKQIREELLNSWIGRSKNELLMKWGMASRIADDGRERQILVFEGLSKKIEAKNKSLIRALKASNKSKI
jgi:hypothetical protein